MNSVRWFALGVLLMVLALPAWASEQAGRITHLYVRAPDGLIFLHLDGQRTARPACATQTYWVVLNENSTTGKQQYAALLAAKLMNRVVTVFGAGGCSRWVDGEDIGTLVIQD